MLDRDKDLYIFETETKPNQYGMIVMVVLLIAMIFCWLVNEIGIFRVGKWEMRIGVLIPICTSIVPLLLLFFKKELRSKPYTKYVLVGLCSLVTLSANTLLNFHATLMLLFPIALTMLYRSKRLGIVAIATTIFSTIFGPLFGYFLGVWDIPLLQELILIGTNGTAEIVGAYDAITGIAVGKILLYLVLPRLTMVIPFAILMFYVISVGKKHIDNQILLNKLSRKDLLTDLYNQNYFQKFTNDNGLDGQIAIIFFDVNGLKEINDANGHEAGDELLKSCAKSILSVCDEHTCGFRAGGDEFVLVMEDADDAKVNQKILAWKDALNEINKDNEGLEGKYFCSMASGYVLGDAKDFPDLVKQADQRMYSNKARMKAE